MLNIFISLLSGALYIGGITLAAWVIGLLYPSRLTHFESSISRSVSTIAVGFLIISNLVFLLVALQVSSIANTRYLLIALCILATYGLKRSGLLRSTINYLSEIVRNRHIFWIATITALYGLWVMITATLPPTARDELIYHLEIPKQWLKLSGHYRSLDNIYAYFPQLGETFFLLGLAGVGEVAAKLTHTLFGILLACMLYSTSRQFMSKPYALGASLLLLSLPSVMVSMGLAYVDLMFAFYAFLALLAACEFIKTTNWRWAFFSGLMLGGCAATKYTGFSLIAVVLCTALWGVTFITRKKTVSFTNAILALVAFTAPAFLLGLPYVLRNIQQTGWPLFPFELPFFTLEPDINWDPDRAKLYLAYLTSFGVPIGNESIWHSIAAPFLVFVKGKFNEPQLYEGVLSPVFLLLPFLLIKKNKPVEVKIHIAFVVVFLYFWAFTTKQIRFLFPALPSLCFLLVYGISRADRKFIFSVALSLCILGNFLTGIDEIMKLRPIQYWWGSETRQDYLRRQMDGYRAYELANHLRSSNSNMYLINMKNYVYYLEGNWRSDFVFERYGLEKMLNRSTDQDHLSAEFFDRKITHLLMDEQFAFSSSWGLEQSSTEKFRRFLSSNTTLAGREGHYSIYKLNKL